MKRSPLPRRKKPIKAVNKERKARLSPKKWGPKGFVEYVKTFWRCCACHAANPECAHEPSWGSRKGTWKDIVPLCSGCHRTRPGAIHQIGRAEWELKNRMDLEEVKARVQAGWEAHST